MGFLSKIRNNMRKEISRMPRRPGMIGDMRFRGEMPRRGGFGNLRNLIRRLKEQRDMGMPRMPGVDDGRVYAGGSPGLYKPGGRFYNPEARLQMPQPIPRAERMPVSNAPSFNPTIFGQPIGDMDFSQMPKISPEDMMNLQVPTEAPVMPMTQDLPEVSPVGMMAGRTLQQDFPAERRMMMAEGDEADSNNIINDYLEGIAFQMVDKQGNVRSKRNEPIVAYTNALTKMVGPEQAQALISEAIERKKIENSQKYLDFITSAPESAKLAEEYKMIQKMRGYAEGGEAFPDLSGDGETTFKDVLIGRGVDLKAEGGEMMTQENEIDAMLGGMDSEEAGAMEDLEQMAPEMEMIDQLVTMVVQMIQQGASEEEVMMFLREQGLDDEDIGTVLQLVAEMAEAEAMPQDGIDAELEQLA